MPTDSKHIQSHCIPYGSKMEFNSEIELFYLHVTYMDLFYQQTPVLSTVNGTTLYTPVTESPIDTHEFLTLVLFKINTNPALNH